MVYSFNGIWPSVDENTFIAPNASIIGDVSLAAGSTCWFGAVLRGDEAKISVGKNSNIQDNAVVHCDRNVPVVIGDNVTVGHGVILHSCEIGDNALIGMGAVILSRAKIGQGAVVAAGSVVKEGAVVAPYSLVVGIPASFKAQLDAKVEALSLANANEYVHLIEKYRQMEAK